MPRPSLLPLSIIFMFLSSMMLALALSPQSMLTEEFESDDASGREVTSISLSSDDGVPGYPLTISFDATGIAEDDTWSDPHWSFDPGLGVFDCGEQWNWDSGQDHVIPAEWVEDGSDDCYNGADEATGAGGTGTTTAASYRVWALSTTGEEYIVASQRPTINGGVEVTWNIPAIQPTGSYSICADQTDGAQTWSMDAADWPYDDRDNRNLDVDDWAWSSEMCTSLDINLYSLMLSADATVVLPGSQVQVSGLVTNPVDGEPTQPATLESFVEYWTEDMDENLVHQQQNMNIIPPMSIFDFSFLVPSNLYNGSSSYYSEIDITVWANSSTGNQVEISTLTLLSSEMAVEFITPAPTQLVLYNEPLLVQAQAYSSYSTWTWQPLADQPFNLKLVIGTSVFDLAIGITTDDQGHLMHLADLSNYGVTGPAWLRLEWIDPSSMAPAQLDRQIYLSDSADTTQFVGEGINLDVEEYSDAGEPGETVTVTVSAEDDWGNPLTGIWLHWQTEVESEDEVGGIYGSSMKYGPWYVSQTDLEGLAELEMMIPSGINVNEGEVSIYVIGYNSTGATDSITIPVPLVQPDVNIDTDGEDYIPGAEVTYTISSTGMVGDVVYFWSTSDGSEGYIESSQGMDEELTLSIPPYWEAGTYSLSVMAVSVSGIASSWYTLTALSGYRISLTADSNSYLTGETIALEYSITSLNPQEEVMFPLSWFAEMVGQHDSQIYGVALEEHGSFTMQIPYDIPNGQYLITLDIGYEQTIVIITVHSDAYSISIEPPRDASTAGEVANVQYNIRSLKEGQDLEYPLEWSALIAGYPESRANGSVSSASGVLAISLPADMVTGSHLIEINIGGQTTTTVMQVRSQDEGTGLSGAFSATNDVLDSATPLLTMLALIIGLAALSMAFLKGRGGDDDGFQDAFVEAAKIAPAPPPIKAAPPPMQAGGMPPGLPSGPPPPAMNGIIKEDGYEWLEHGGGIWYRTAYSGAPWEPWNG